MTSEDNKSVVREFVEAVNRQDWRRLEELLAPDFVRHSSTFGQPQIRNREQLRDFLAGEAAAFPDAQETRQFLIAEGDMAHLRPAVRDSINIALVALLRLQLLDVSLRLFRRFSARRLDDLM